MDLVALMPTEWLQALPPPVLALLVLFTGVVSGASILGGQIKKYAGDVAPDSKLGKLLRLLDVLSIVSTPVHDKAVIAQQQQALAENATTIRTQASTIQASVRPGAPPKDAGVEP